MHTYNLSADRVGQLLQLVRDMPGEDFQVLKDGLEYETWEVPALLADLIEVNSKVRTKAEPSISGSNPADQEMPYACLIDHLTTIATDGLFKLTVDRVQELEPMETFEVKFKGYKSQIVEFGDFPHPEDFRKVIDHLTQMARLNATGLNRLGATKGFKGPGYGLLFNKGSYEEGKLRSLLSPAGKTELDRFLALGSATRKSAMEDIAEMGQPRAGPYTFILEPDDDLATLLIEGYALSKARMSSIPCFAGHPVLKAKDPDSLLEWNEETRHKLKFRRGVPPASRWRKEIVPTAKQLRTKNGLLKKELSFESAEVLNSGFDLLELDVSGDDDDVLTRQSHKIGTGLSLSDRCSSYLDWSS